MDQARQQAITSIVESTVPLGPPTTMEYANYLASLGYAFEKGEWPSRAELTAYLATYRFSRCFWDTAMMKRKDADVTR